MNVTDLGTVCRRVEVWVFAEGRADPLSYFCSCHSLPSNTHRSILHTITPAGKA